MGNLTPFGEVLRILINKKCGLEVHWQRIYVSKEQKIMGLNPAGELKLFFGKTKQCGCIS
jgi:hypothetical protein